MPKDGQITGRIAKRQGKDSQIAEKQVKYIK